MWAIFTASDSASQESEFVCFSEGYSLLIRERLNKQKSKRNGKGGEEKIKLITANIEAFPKSSKCKRIN